MKANELRKRLRTTPFHTLTVCLGSNKTYTIPHSEFAALSPDGQTLVVWPSDGGGMDVLDVRLIERVEVRKRSSSRCADFSGGIPSC